ncbi:hypothetical protein BDR07DRAFT_1420461, partial [Suillus spraguei]
MRTAGEPKKDTTYNVDMRVLALIKELVRISRSPRWREKSRNFTFTDKYEQAQIVAWEKKGI